LWRYSSLAALIASGLSPVYALLLLEYKGYALMALILALFMFWRHRGNIRKLLDGTESGFGKK
jgi:glycerol-3-phosphate acyltransferase PlsY